MQSEITGGSLHPSLRKLSPVGLRLFVFRYQHLCANVEFVMLHHSESEQAIERANLQRARLGFGCVETGSIPCTHGAHGEASKSSGVCTEALRLEDHES